MSVTVLVTIMALIFLVPEVFRRKFTGEIPMAARPSFQANAFADAEQAVNLFFDSLLGSFRPTVNDAKWMQARLKAAGLYNDYIDSVVGRQTIAAIIHYLEKKPAA
jgi:hypothetical protein